MLYLIIVENRNNRKENKWFISYNTSSLKRVFSFAFKKSYNHRDLPPLSSPLLAFVMQTYIKHFNPIWIFSCRRICHHYIYLLPLVLTVDISFMFPLNLCFLILFSLSLIYELGFWLFSPLLQMVYILFLLLHLVAYTFSENILQSWISWLLKCWNEAIFVEFSPSLNLA